MNQAIEACPAQAVDFDKFSERFLAREDAMILIGQLNQLVKAVQRHRGISMGMLAGNTDFKNEFTKLQSQVERRLATLEAFARHNQMLNQRDKENLSLAWATIHSNWEGDRLVDNFELHSHFIEQLLVMIASLARKLELPLMMHADELSSSLGISSFSQARALQQSDILNFVGKLLPETIEQVARIRGTAAYAAAVTSMDGLDERKLRFWVSSLRKHAENIREQSEELDQELGGVVSKLRLMKQNELQLLQFLNTVESAVFMGKGGRDEAHRLFNMATDVIEVYWEIVMEGLAVVQTWQREDLEAWMSLSPDA
ncbi:lytic murein transglycosylase [Agaribacterium haliotis]|uniref:lytic murein transglycosylase n=1 Tax=Agaribacterium haliotis TaxID=2013869 RepID=UPI000BB56BC3|nr:lytic murein transglycosylase [Agaribacterium haliotis]